MYIDTTVLFSNLQLAAGLTGLFLTGNGSRFLEEFLERPYKQAINRHAAGAEFFIFDPRKFAFWRVERLRNGQTMVQWCGRLQHKG